MEDSPSPEPPAKLRTVCCIGDIHGYFVKLQSLWSNLEASIRPEDFQSALIIFLGDYCDRGPDTRRVIEFLTSLPARFPRQKHVFLSGNHDFAFAAFLRVLPPPPPDGADFKEGWKDYELDEDQEGWFKGEGYEQMHLQGRRWAGKIKVEFNSVKETYYQGSIYDAAPTFESYGVPHGSADLFRAVPEDHKKFLADLVWVHEEDGVHVETPEGIKKYRLIAVHAGLEKGKKVDKQLVALKAKDTRFPNVEALSGRKNVWDVPEELAEPPTIVVSGHHGKLHVDGLRLIIDEGGGYKDKPVAAVVLPSLRIVRSTVVAMARSTIKGTRSRVQSSSSKRRFAPDPIPFDESRFCSSESQHRFHIDRRQHYILERGFDFAENFGGAIPVGTLQSVVDKMQWSPFCSTFHTSDRVDCDIVREFFANLPDRRGNTVFVRGVWVDFSREVINSVVRAPPVEDHTFAGYASNLRNFTIDGLKRMVQQDGVGITVQTIHKSYLTPEALVWLHFICHTLMPSSHLTEVTRERLSLLYSIMSTEPVDVGSVVHSFIISPGRVRSYFFPAIITRLCHRAQVLLPMESTMSLMAPINGKAIKKMLHERGKAPSPSPSPAGPESPGPAPHEVEEKLEEERVPMVRPRSTLKDRVRKLEREVSHLRKLQVVQAGKMNRLLAHFGLSTENEEEDRGPDDDLNEHPGSSDAMVDG